MTSGLKMLPSACGLGQHFQDLGHSFSLYGPPSRPITYIYCIYEATSAGFYAGPLACSNWNLEMLVFVDGRKRKKPLKQGENQHQTQPTYGTGPESNPGHTDGRRILSSLLHPCSPKPASQALQLSRHNKT